MFQEQGFQYITFRSALVYLCYRYSRPLFMEKNHLILQDNKWEKPFES
jgi:hypothetical protein